MRKKNLGMPQAFLIFAWRISSRATSADPFLRSMMDMFVSSRNSPAQMIQNRGYFAVKFSKFVKETKGWLCYLAYITVINGNQVY